MTAASEHTPTPWKLFTAQDGTKFLGIGDDTGGGITDGGFGLWRDDEEALANARRIVACVNACAGIETETLENFEDIKADAAKRADEAAARLQRIAAIIEAVDGLVAYLNLDPSVETTVTTATEITMVDLAKIYEAATLDRPVVDPHEDSHDVPV